jgi:tetratricopeptide (TPR) repeat protein
MFARGVLLAAARQLDTAETIAHEFDQWDEERPDPIVRASAMLLRVRIALRRGDSKSAEPLTVQSLALLPPDAPVLVKFRHVRQLAELRNDALRVDDALRLWHDALKLANESGRASRRVDALSHLAFAYHAAGQAERARRFSDESIAVAEEANDWMSIANAYNTRAILYDAAGDMAGERRALQNAIDNARRAGAKAEESLFSANMSNFFLMTNEPKTAIAYAERALPLARQVGDTEGEVVALSNMGLGYIALRQIDTGKRLVNEALAIEQQRGMVASVADGNRELGAALERAGDAAGAIAALHAYRHDSDAILRSGTQKAMLAVQEQFDADQRSAQLELLYRENRLKAEQLKHGTLLQQLMGVVVGQRIDAHDLHAEVVVAAAAQGFGNDGLRSMVQCLWMQRDRRVDERGIDMFVDPIGGQQKDLAGLDGKRLVVEFQFGADAHRAAQITLFRRDADAVVFS